MYHVAQNFSHFIHFQGGEQITNGGGVYWATLNTSTFRGTGGDKFRGGNDPANPYLIRPWNKNYLSYVIQTILSRF